MLTYLQNIVKILSKHYPNSVQILSKYFANNVKKSSKHCRRVPPFLKSSFKTWSDWLISCQRKIPDWESFWQSVSKGPFIYDVSTFIGNFGPPLPPVSMCQIFTTPPPTSNEIFQLVRKFNFLNPLLNKIKRLSYWFTSWFEPFTSFFPSSKV